MNYTDLPEFDSHETVIRLDDPATSLRGYIAIHNRNLGPAVGGTRVYAYSSDREALQDALRLSRAMSYKCAIADVQFGGGKGVIIADPDREKTAELLRSYARHIQQLQGQFFTGEDVGLTEDDVQLMLQEAPYFIGRSHLAGDPSPYAALSTFYCIQAASKLIFGTADLHGCAVAIKGVGKVGSALARLLLKAGAEVTVADIKLEPIHALQRDFASIRVVAPETIHTEQVDIYAPCALGNEFHKENVADIKTRVICGAANNQLADAFAADQLHARQILYVPDFVANAGGLINVIDELESDGYHQERVLSCIESIKQTLEHILNRSEAERISPHFVAERLARERFMKISALV